MERYVLYSESRGVYLGECLGLGFWSKWDAVRQDAAVTFESPADGEQYLSSWLSSAPEDRQWIKVKASDLSCLPAVYATMAECVRVGLPAWDTTT